MTCVLNSCRLLIGGVVVAWSAAALAAPADYECNGGATLTADFSPRTAQVRFDGQQWTMQRVREAREARYLARDGAAITLLRSQATLERKGQPTLACKLILRALRPEALGVPPAAGTTPR
ncbi:MAG TPA: MliC family protein [Ideonella sp.]|jgi:hypothetical protein|nr:MliC family protein [Ideonella sp.]